MFKAKTLSVICAVVVLSISILPCFAADVKPEIKYAQGGKIDGNIVDISHKNSAKAHYSTSSAFYSKQTVTSRETLTDDEKEIYDYFKNAPFGTTQYNVQYNNFYTAPDYSYYANMDIGKIMYALQLDCPDLFYLEWCEWEYSWYEVSGSPENFDEGDKLGLLRITFCYDTSMGNINTLKAEIDSKLAALDVSKCHNRYDIIKTFHQFLCSTADYDFEYLDRFDPEFPEYVKHNIVGTLLDGSCVCQGYAESFKMLCDMYKIPCVCVQGEANGGGHEWNAVLMDDCKWYLMDVTWDDTTGTSNYFLKSGAYFAANDHTEYIYPYSPRVPYSKTNFSAATVMTEFAATYNCRASKTRSGNFLYRSVFDANEPIYYNGLWLKNCTASATGAKFTAPSGSSYANENWQLILIGDINGDGECSVEDYSAAVTKALGSESAHISAANMAADADFDGYLDVLDLSIIERMTSRSYTEIVVAR